MEVAARHLRVVEPQQSPEMLPEDSLPYDPSILEYATIGTSEASKDSASRVVVRPDIGFLGVIEGQGEDPAGSARLVEEEVLRHVAREMKMDPASPSSSLFKAVNRVREKGGWLDRRQQLGASAVFAVIHRDGNDETSVSVRNMGPGKSFLLSDSDPENRVTPLTSGSLQVGQDGNYSYDEQENVSVARTAKLRPGDRIVLTTASTATVQRVEPPETVAPEAPSASRLQERLQTNLEEARRQTLGISVQAFEAARRESDPQRSADILRESGRENAAVLVARMPRSRIPHAGETTDASDTPADAVVSGGAGTVEGLAAPSATSAVIAESAARTSTPTQTNERAVKAGRFRPLRSFREHYRSAKDADGEMGTFGVVGIATAGLLREGAGRRRKLWIDRRVNRPYFEERNMTEDSRRDYLDKRYGNRKWGMAAKVVLAVLAYKAIADPGHAEWFNVFGKENDHGLDLFGWPLDHGDQHQGDGRGFDGDPFNRDPSMFLNDDKVVPDRNDIPTNNGFDIIPFADGDGMQFNHKPIFGFSINDIDKNHNGRPDIFDPGDQGKPGPDLNPGPGTSPTTEGPVVETPGTGGQPGVGGQPAPGSQPVGEEARLRVLASQPFVVEPSSNEINEIDQLGDHLGHPITRAQANEIYYEMPDSLRATAIELPSHAGPDMYAGPTAGDWRISAPATNATFSPRAVDYLVDQIQSYN
jgi:hypothetical protein